MYYFEFDKDMCQYKIYSPEGDFLANVQTMDEVILVLQHLNRVVI